MLCARYVRTKVLCFISMNFSLRTVSTSEGCVSGITVLVKIVVFLSCYSTILIQ